MKGLEEEVAKVFRENWALQQEIERLAQEAGGGKVSLLNILTRIAHFSIVTVVITVDGYSY